MSQLALFSEHKLSELVRPDYQDSSSLEERFTAFHKANPHVYKELVRRALGLRDKGIKRFGIAAIFESLRYDAALESGNDGFKLNNDYRAFYARLIMSRFPTLDGFFETREQPSAPEQKEPNLGRSITLG